MRKELEQSQQIDRYLDGEMNTSEKVQFEEKIAQNKALKNEVETQRQLRESIFQTGIKKAAQKAFKKIKLYKKLFIGGAITVIAIIGFGFLFLNSNTSISEKNHNNSPEKITKDNLGEHYKDPNTHLESQFYNIKNGVDTIIETQNGMIVLLPNNGFVNNDGNIVKGDITIEIKEAFDPATIMKSGLSTKSDGKMLETGGMFYIKAYQNGEELKINPEDPMVVDIPTTNREKSMLFFDGEILEDGTINWKNPRAFENWLTPVDILSLNFYPPNYLTELEKLKQNASNKLFTDSLYYSFERECGEGYSNKGEGVDKVEITSEKPSLIEKKLLYEELQKYDKEMDSLTKISGNSKSARTRLRELLYIIESHPANKKDFLNNLDSSSTELSVINYCGINPSKIKAIWQEKFNNTNLATKEFEQRIPTIHRSCENNVLDVYVNNLDQNLSFCDSLAATKASGAVREKLLEYAARGDGRVQLNNIQAKRLANYYQRKHKQYSNILIKTQEKFWAEQEKLDQKATQKSVENNIADNKRKSEMLQQELERNLIEAYRQLGKKRIPNRNLSFAAPGYIAPITNMGWKNVDRYVTESTIYRTSLNYTDPNSGKKAQIKYETASLSIDKNEQYDNVFVYFIPKGFSSFNRAKKTSNGFTFNLNEMFQYDIMIVGHKKDEIYTYRQENVSHRPLGVLALSKTSRSQFDKLTGYYSWSSARKDLQQDMDYYLFKRKDNKRQKKNSKLKDLKNKLMPIVYPCGGDVVNNYNEVEIIEKDVDL